MSKEPYQVVPIPRQRRFALDAGRLGRGKHTVYFLDPDGHQVEITTYEIP